jgi:anhydro-N-acetylmuramic acid kinase
MAWTLYWLIFQTVFVFLDTSALPFDAHLRHTFLQLNQSGTDELHQAALAGNALVKVYAQAVRQLLLDTGLPASDVAAIGAHGQTVRHQPGQHDGIGTACKSIILRCLLS